MTLKFRVVKCPEISSKRFTMPLPKPAIVQLDSSDGRWLTVQAFTNREGVYFAYEVQDREWRKFSQKETEELMAFYIEISRAMRGHVDKREEPAEEKHPPRRGGRRAKAKAGMGAA